VLRVTTLYAATAATTAQYYTRYLTQADCEIPGEWMGRQAAGLGLQGEVTTEALQSLLEGRHPTTRVALGNPLLDRVTSSGTVVRAVAGFDATFSAPKSLSVWWALSGDEGLAQCHDVAVRALVSCVERYGSTTRIRSNGHRLHPESQGLTVAVFRQTTSRLDDPQLHSHVVISSKVQTEDGRWLALDARTLKGFQRALGGLYQSVLRAELTARYGVAFGEIDKGQAEIAGVPEQLLEQFSKRTVQVDSAFQTALAEFWAREGRDPTPKERGALGRQAAADTRNHKSGLGTEDLSARWLAEGAAVGITPASLDASIQTAARHAPRVQFGTYQDLLAEMTERRSAWHRLDVLQVACDTTRPNAAFDGVGWLEVLERDVDVVLQSCIDLDPNETSVRRRSSDGRSVWIEPSARHHTSPEILVQEERIVSWAIEAQLEPATYAPVPPARLDVMQREAASMVAGHDRLVLIVGPAGAGKTEMLGAAARDLSVQGRVAFGLAPTAKAARKLEAETRMGTDTVAKLVHEWTHPDRPPEPRWCLPGGTTVIVDEAGMLNTGHLHTLTHLADQCRWRLVLIGDPHQLQAVGRGGMFAELCATGRVVELDTIHRFRNHWEAKASLGLRHGDPTVLGTYLDYDRIRAAPLAEHLDTIATAWITANQNGERLAITTTSNEHVAAINQTIQQHRDFLDELGPNSVTGQGGSFRIGDVIVTRRNERHLHTTTGDSVRNRDYWTINHITPTGELTVTRIDGHGTVTLPNKYVSEHVQLGYAATEPGNQSDTTNRSITLATGATTCQGLYVGATRGRDENLICVVTDTHHPAEALDVLQRILATDRTDQPAIATRRELAAAVPHPPVLTARCEIPDWFQQLPTETRRNVVDASAAIAEHEAIDADLPRQIAQLDQQLVQLAARCMPHDEAIAVAKQNLNASRDQRLIAAYELAQAGRLHRHSARHRVERADRHLAKQQAVLDQTVERAGPILDQRDQLTSQRENLRAEQTSNRRAIQTAAAWLENATDSLHALTTWHHWANGHKIPDAKVAEAAIQLHNRGGDHARLAAPLLGWCEQRNLITYEQPQPERRRTVEPQARGIEIDF